MRVTSAPSRRVRKDRVMNALARGLSVCIRPHPTSPPHPTHPHSPPPSRHARAVQMRAADEYRRARSVRRTRAPAP
eukprot:6181028-Pleurochrysis_carterae.AAC.1